MGGSTRLYALFSNDGRGRRCIFIVVCLCNLSAHIFAPPVLWMSINAEDYIDKEVQCDEALVPLVIACVKHCNEKENIAYHCSGVQSVEDTEIGKKLKLVLCSGDICAMKTFNVNTSGGNIAVEEEKKAGFGF